jgi:hypothetical protein
MKKLLTVVPSVIESEAFIESDPKQRIKESLKQLSAQAERINLLSAELERSIWEFQEISTQVNQDSRFFRVKQRHVQRFRICEFRSVYLPFIQQKSIGRFVVTSHAINLSKSEQKAPSLLEKLRGWIKK